MCEVLRSIKSFFIIIFRLLFCLILVILTPVTIILLLPIWIYRQIVILLAKWFKKDLGKILTTRSSLLCPEPVYKKPFYTLTLLQIFEGKVDVEIIRENFRTRVMEIRNEKGELKYPELTQNIQFWMGYPFFKDVEGFNINEHIYYVNDDENFSADLQTMKKLTHGLDYKRFSKDRAMWEMAIIPNILPDIEGKNPRIKDGQHYSAIVVREHHALADGFSIFQLLQNTNDSQKMEFMDSRDYTQGLGKTSLAQKILKGLGIMLKVPWDISEVLTLDSGFLGSVFEVDKKYERNLLASKTYVDTPESCAETFASDASPPFIYKDVLKTIKNLHGSSGVATIYAAICGAVRNTMFPEALAGKSKFPKEILMAVPLPLPGRTDKLRNNVTCGPILLPIGEADGKRRLKIIHEKVERLKTSTIPLTIAVFSVITGAMPGWIKVLFMNMRYRLHGIVLSNNAGPLKPYDCFGYPSVDLYISSGASIRTYILGMFFITEAGYAKVGVGADIKLIRDDSHATQFVENFMKELNLLQINDGSFCMENV